MRRQVKLLKFLTWYKTLQEEQAKLRVINCKINLEKLLQEKKEIINFRKNNYDMLGKKRLFNGEELKYILFQTEKSLEFEDMLDKKIKMQKEELKNLLDLLEKAYKEKKLMETLKNKAQQLLSIESIKKFYKEMDDLILLRIGRKNV